MSSCLILVPLRPEFYSTTIKKTARKLSSFNQTKHQLDVFTSHNTADGT